MTTSTTDTASAILETAAAVAELDVLATLAERAESLNLCEPEFVDEQTIDISAGRHLVVVRDYLGVCTIVRPTPFPVEAVEQVREVVNRFPGHVESQQRLVRLMEDGGTAADLRDALVAGLPWQYAAADFVIDRQ